jgi:hypothetical protein
VFQTNSSARFFLPQVEGLEDRITPDASAFFAHFQQLSAQEQQLHQVLQGLPVLINDHLKQFNDWLNSTRTQLQSDIQKIEARISQLSPAEQQIANAFITQAVNEIAQEQSLEQAEQKIVAAVIAQLQKFEGQVVALVQSVTQEELTDAVTFLQQQNAATDARIIAFFHQLVQQASDDINQATVDLSALGAASS